MDKTQLFPCLVQLGTSNIPLYSKLISILYINWRHPERFFIMVYRKGVWDFPAEQE